MVPTWTSLDHTQKEGIEMDKIIEVQTIHSELAEVLKNLRQLSDHESVAVIGYISKLDYERTKAQRDLERERVSALRRVDSLRHLQRAHAKTKRRMKTVTEDNHKLRARLNGLARKYGFDV